MPEFSTNSVVVRQRIDPFATETGVNKELH